MATTMQPRALDAFSEGLKMPPAYANDAEAWSGVSVCEWRLPWLDGFELAENSDFVIAYHSAGSRKVRAACNGPWSRTRSTPGLISVIPPGRRVEYRIEGAVSFSSIHIPAPLIENLTGKPAAAEPDFRFAFEDDFASACVDALLDEAQTPRTSHAPLVDSMTRSLVLRVLCGYEDRAQSAAIEDRREAWLVAALDYIDLRLDLPLKLEDLAQHVEMSRAHFVRRFREATGEPPHRYVMLRRVDRAKQLLRNSRDALADIAHEVGFSSQSHFTQVFHALTGSTPGQFRGAP